MICLDIIDYSALGNWFLVGFVPVSVAGIAGLGVSFVIRFFNSV